MDFEEVYHRYAKDVFKFCLSLCGNQTIAEDIMSETFLKAIQSCGNFKGKCTVKVWLCQIAKNLYFDMLRKNSKMTAFPDDVQNDSDFEMELLDQTDILRIHKRLHRLKEPYKEVFSLRIFAELSFADIGEIFKKSESWARVTFHRAKLKLREGEENGKM